MKKLVMILALAFSGCYAYFPPEPVCDPGDTQSCNCTDGRNGAQRCDGDGGGWGECVCSGTTTPPDSGTINNCRPSGSQTIQCGCWGYAVMGRVVVATSCCSDYAVQTACSGYCYDGGIPWTNVCQ